MATFPFPVPDPVPVLRVLPDYLPARMLNEFVYCPRLFFYEWVEGVFEHSGDTVEGAVQHKRVDKEGPGLRRPEELEGAEKTRSVTLASEEHRLIAKMDLLDIADGIVTPIDYKHGKPLENGEVLEAWPSDRVQLAVQAIILRNNGYTCEEGIIYYAATRQRVRVPIDDALVEQTIGYAHEARRTAEVSVIPPPLADHRALHRHHRD